MSAHTASMDLETASVEELDKHRDCAYFGPKQGAQCRCGATFLPLSGKRVDVEEAHRSHQAAALHIAGLGAPATMRQWISEHATT